MDIALYTLTSPLHDEVATNAVSADFIADIEAHLKCRMDFRGHDFTGYGNHDLDIIYVRTGGTEGLFREVFPSLEGKIVLLTSGKSNSLAASLEILSYLNRQGRRGEIIHGSTGYIADRIMTLAKVESARKKLRGSNLGLIGQPSDWLISSDPDRDEVRNRLGINLVDVPIEELVEEYHKVNVLPSGTIADELERNLPDPVRKYKEGALRIYAALKVIIDRYSLSGLTLRCFDLLDSLGNTGCLALAMLNAEGIPAGCEGDVPALITMAVGQSLTGTCGFQANPSRIDPETGELLLAHCTVPFNMVRKYSFNTHFESGIGIAIHGEMPEGDATVFKLSGDLSRSFCCKARLLENIYENNLCRTQIVLKLKENASGICRDYFLKNPVGNHHIVFNGDCTSLFEAFVEGM